LQRREFGARRSDLIGGDVQVAATDMDVSEQVSVPGQGGVEALVRGVG